MSFIRVMCAGDSITMGSPEFRGGYRRPLNNLAPNLQLVGSQCDHPTQTAWIGVGHHEGYSGGTTTQVLTNIKAQIPIYLPEIVLWMTGTNDITTGTASASAVYNAALEVLAFPSVNHVIVSAPPPRQTDNPLYQQTLDFIAEINAQFEGVLPDGLHYCLAGAAIDNDSLLYDDFHPRTEGYEKMAPVWLAAVESLGVQTQQPEAGEKVSLW